MSQSVHIISKSISASGPSEGRCLPCSGISRKGVALSLLPSHANRRTCSRIKAGSVLCASGAASFVCRASSGGPKRNSDFSKQNRPGFSRNRNRQNEERDSFSNLDDTDLLMSRNGPLLSLSGTSKLQATATPGQREKEIVQLFRKVQAQLRERAAVKEEKKAETSKGKVKESETVDSLLKLLRKHSTEQGRKKVSSDNSGDFAADMSRQSVSHNEDRSLSFFNSNNKDSNGVTEPNSTSFSRPPSNFRRTSPVPRVKFQPVYPRDNPLSSTSYSDLTDDKKKQPEDHPSHAPQSEVVSDEPELILEQEESSSFPDSDVLLGEFSESESSDVDTIEKDNDQEKENEHEELSALKLPELRALAKSRGLKGFSKMKKAELVELLSGGSV